MDKSVWMNPKSERSLDQSQVPLWFWNDKLEREELIRQLKLKSETGVTCTIPHARTNMGEGYIGDYLGEEWFGNIQTVLEYKKACGEPVWLYDEIDWPAGTCNKTITRNENYREQYLKIDKVQVPANTVFRAQLKEFNGRDLREAKEENYQGCAFNIYIVDAETKEELNTPDYFADCIFGPEFEFQSDRDAVVYLIKKCVDSYDQGGSEQVSYLNKEATGAFLKSTYEKYYERFPTYFGETIRCMFNDETRMSHALVWSEDFREQFMQRKGYDITPQLYKLICEGEAAGRLRCDYFDVVASLYQEHYFGVLKNWCAEHGIDLYAHLLGEETLYGHVRYSGDYLRQNRYLDCVGADHLGKGIGSLNIKFTSCAAHSYGKEKTAVEVFAGCGWDLTFEEYIRMITWMYQQGMQGIINHGFFYSDRGKRKDDWPPSEFFQWKGWDRMPQGNDMTRRLTYAFTGGKNEADILIYHPTESFWKYYIPEQLFTTGFAQGPYLSNETSARIDRETQLIYNGLLTQNLDYDLIHKDALPNFQVDGNKIRNICNNQSFSVLVLPMCEVLPLEAAQLCRDFVQAGGKLVLLDKIPHQGMKEEEDEKIRHIFQELCDSENVRMFFAEDKGEIYKWIRQNIPHPVKIVKGTDTNENNHMNYDSYLIDPYFHRGEDLTGVMFNRYLKNGKRNTLFMNYSSREDQIEVEIEKSKNTPQVWNTFTGEVRDAQVLQQEGDTWRILLDLPCCYGMLVVSDEL